MLSLMPQIVTKFSESPRNCDYHTNTFSGSQGKAIVELSRQFGRTENQVNIDFVFTWNFGRTLEVHRVEDRELFFVDAYTPIE